MTTRPAVEATASSSSKSMTTRAVKAEPKAPITIIEACQDPKIFGPWFKDRQTTWAAWFVFLKVIFGLGLDEAELAIFRKCTGRNLPALVGYLSATLIIGRRGGKSLIMALIAAFLACFFDWTPFLIDGERGVIMIVAADRRQATVIFKFARNARHSAAVINDRARDARHDRTQ